jgi:glycosyltransferase involved in cell wall biosynthesis
MSAELRLLIDGTPLLGNRTGIGRYTTSLVGELAKMSTVDVRVMGFTMRGWRRLRSTVPEGTRASGLPVPARALRACWSRSELPPVELIAGRADVVHGTNFVLPPSARAPGVVTVHDLAFLDVAQVAEPELPGLVQRCARRAAVVCTPTKSVANAVSERLGVPSSRIVVTPLGVDREWFSTVPADAELLRKYGLPSEYLLFIGADGPRKGLGELLDAHSADLPPLVIAGPGEIRRDERVIRTGYLPDADLRRVVAGARALVLPSCDEGFGLPTLEAFACGVPVVCTDVPALREVTAGHAVLFPFGDSNALRAALRHAPTLAPNKAARAHAETFTWRACAEATLDAYRRAV